MSESYDYLKERVAELAFEIKRKDEVLAWDADKILECTTKIVEKNKRIATLEAERNNLIEFIQTIRPYTRTEILKDIARSKGGG